MALADTGYWLALANRRDRWHDAALTAARGLDQPLIVTWPVLVETCHLLVSRLGVNAEILFLQEISKNVTVHELSSQRLPEICALMEKYRDLPMDLTDASLVLAAEDLEDGFILSTDQRDFDTYRWKSRYPFRNLLTDI